MSEVERILAERKKTLDYIRYLILHIEGLIEELSFELQAHELEIRSVERDER